MLRLALVALLLVVYPPATNEFVPHDVIKARLVGCIVAGVKGQPDYAEAFIIVRYSNPEPSTQRVADDFTPIIARRTMEQGGAPAAIEDCRQWFKDVKKQMEAGHGEDKAH